MEIYILFFTTFLICLLGWFTFRYNYVSPTIYASFLFCICSFLYIIFLPTIGSGISWQAVGIILLSIVAIFLGEFIAARTSIRIRSENSTFRPVPLKEVSYFEVSKDRTNILFLFMIVVFLLRIYDLARYSGLSIFSLFEILASTRTAVVLGDYSNSLGKVVSFGTIISLCISQLYIFFIVYNALNKKCKPYLFLPVVGAVLIQISTTARIGLLLIGFEFLVAYLLCIFILNYKYRVKKYKLKLNKIVWLTVGFIVLFFIWGNLTRNSTKLYSNTWASQLIGYSCASLYGFENFLQLPWKSIYFGSYSLRYFYSFFNLMTKYSAITAEFPYYYIGKIKANIYTALPVMITDFGVVGMFCIYLVFSFLIIKCIKCIIYTNPEKPTFYILLHLIFIGLFCFFMTAIGNQFSQYFFNPREIYNLIGIYISAKFLVKFQIKRSM